MNEDRTAIEGEMVHFSADTGRWERDGDPIDEELAKAITERATMLRVPGFEQGYRAL
jgi:hypothetical protein